MTMMRAIHAVLAAGAVALIAGSAAEAQTDVAIAMASGVNQVPSLVAEDQGYFAEEGLNVELKPVSRGAVAIEAVSGGSVQFAESAHTTFFSAVNEGLPLVGVAVAARGYYGKLIAAPEHKDLKTLADFKGMRIGTQVGTGMHMVLQMLLAEQGMSEEDFQISNVRVTDMPAAMATGGTFDAVLGWEPGMQRIVQAGKGVEVITARQIEEMAKITYPFILSAPREFIEANPEVVQGVVNAYAKAHKFIRENPDEAVAVYKKFLDSTGADLDTETVKYMMFDTDRFGGVAFGEADMVDLASTRDYLMKTREMSAIPEPEKAVIRDFGDKADAASAN